MLDAVSQITKKKCKGKSIAKFNAHKINGTPDSSTVSAAV